MNPLPDRTVVLSILISLGLVFALVFWSVRLQAPREAPLLWKSAPGSGQPGLI